MLIGSLHREHILTTRWIFDMFGKSMIYSKLVCKKCSPLYLVERMAKIVHDLICTLDYSREASEFCMMISFHISM